ncbi:hypothetical protein [Saccharopolyspora hattusasensis]|uniref:hypothetical protein n=1 Tax=Saccharopolyspora hattusasensis TaxID=1128679 RepID=UPI003D976D8D
MRRSGCLVCARRLPGHPGAPHWISGPLGEAGPTVVVPLVLAAVYAALRALEPHMPAWLTRLLLGSNQPPTYRAE